MSIGDTLWSEQRKQLIADLKDAEVGSQERIVAMQEHEKKRGLMSEIISHAMYMHGAFAIIGEASKGKNTENADGLPESFVGSTQESMMIALQLMGVEIDDTDKDKSTKKKK